MSANVRCAGGTRAHPSGFVFFNCEPCGWKGERGRHAIWGTIPDRREQRELLTAKPCPRCHGQVKLIEDGER